MRLPKIWIPAGTVRREDDERVLSALQEDSRSDGLVILVGDEDQWAEEERLEHAATLDASCWHAVRYTRNLHASIAIVYRTICRDVAIRRGCACRSADDFH